MPYMYFLVTGSAVVVATIVAGLMRTSGTRRAIQQQLVLTESVSEREKTTEDYKEPAAMVSAG